jgi:hypothetical protein
MWKWNVALEAYQRHFGSFAGKDSKMLEIGVQSGGSVLMYHQVLPKTYYYGMDINRNCVSFNDNQATIYLGDQASVAGWQHFFSVITPSLDICIDDGGHQAHQMLATVQQALPRMNPGGFFLTEDIHGINQNYNVEFFQPAADTLGHFLSFTGATLESIHLYPFIFGVQMMGGSPWPKPAATFNVDTIPALTTALPSNLGGVVRLSNPTWGSFFTPDALKNFFNTFYNMYEGVVREEPAHCHNTMADVCTMIATNTPQQNLVKGVHIYQTEVLVEVHAAPPAIQAVRKGSQWIPYNGP